MKTSFFYKILIVLTYYLGFFSNILIAQIDESYKFTYPSFNKEEEGNLYFRIENNNFIKNNEFFGKYTEGYTLPGYAVQPSFMYYASKNLRLKLGAHIIKYSGIKDFSEIAPIVSVHVVLGETWNMILGNIKGNVHHKLIEPLYNPEWQYFKPGETGLQFYHNSNKLWIDTWVDWEQFIFKGDNIPEMFTGGVSLDYKLSDNESNLKVSLPFQFTAFHLGGQISDYDTESYSLVNAAIGLKLQKLVNSKFIKSVGLNTYLCGYKDLTNALGLPFSNGKAIYPTGIIKYKSGEFMVGYWNSSNFYSPKGNALFYSISDHNNEIYEKNRQLITTKLTFSRKLWNQLRFGAQAETYFDIDASRLEYSYGISLIFTPNFFIKNITYR